MSNDKKFIDSFAEKLDSMLSGPGQAWNRFADRFFQYTYRETTKGVFGLFDSPEKISGAAKKAHEKGYTNFDCFTPFPVHGLELDMGFKRSKVPYITFFMGLTGLAIAFILQSMVHEQVIPRWWEFFDPYPNLRSYPLNIGGKPTFSWPAMIPICFELTVLIGGHSTVIGLILLARLYRPFRKVLHPDLTNDKFGLWIPSDSAQYSEESVKQFLTELGAKEITTVSNT